MSFHAGRYWLQSPHYIQNMLVVNEINKKSPKMHSFLSENSLFWIAKTVHCWISYVYCMLCTSFKILFHRAVHTISGIYLVKWSLKKLQHLPTQLMALHRKMHAAHSYLNAVSFTWRNHFIFHFARHSRRKKKKIPCTILTGVLPYFILYNSFS